MTIDINGGNSKVNNMIFHEYAITKIITLAYKFGYNIISLYHHSTGIENKIDYNYQQLKIC